MSSPVTITDSLFDTEVIQSDKPVLAYFWASWCGPCRLVSPSIDWAAVEYANRLKVVKLEVDPNPATVKECQVEGVPALRFFKNGQLVESREGAITKQKLSELIDAVLTA
ncbi:MAG: thioredoxin [Cyanobacteria bacterium SID2]|nr:thioredoxin [Cyanobacteria bacterium SID2]MBP0003586.1 thioredoxin [Cyanobacteria bacterium SBC]